MPRTGGDKPLPYDVNGPLLRKGGNTDGRLPPPAGSNRGCLRVGSDALIAPQKKGKPSVSRGRSLPTRLQFRIPNSEFRIVYPFLLQVDGRNKIKIA